MEDLDVFKLAHQLAIKTYAVTKGFLREKGEDRRAVEAFLSAVETLSKLNKDPEFYDLAVKAIRD